MTSTAASASKEKSGGAAKLSDILDEMAGELVDEWAKQNAHKIWLGGPSRKAIRADIAKLLRKSYDLAKDRYGSKS